MDQFIQYLYEYEGGERVRNLGFMKLEKKMDKIEIQIYAKDLDEVAGIYFQKQDGETYIASWENPVLLNNSKESTTPNLEVEVQEEVEPCSCSYEKIQRQDLSRLPRKEWRLANNNFLLHGYYNYHHLLYIQEEEKLWIGVPGIFHPKEKVAAESFGFPEFRRIENDEVELLPEEKNSTEDFGYWCRQVE